MNLEVLEKIEGYLGKSTEEAKIFRGMAASIDKTIGITDREILDIASDKPPEFAYWMAHILPESRFIHFKDDNVRSKKLRRKYSNLKNLEVVYSENDPEFNPPYSTGMAFLTLHELDKPQKSLKRISKFLEDKGNLIVVDYDLNWFRELAKSENWEDREATKQFKKHVFTSGNEKKVLREELDCMQNHTKWGLEDYLKIFSKAGFSKLDSRSYEIKTPWGEMPKYFSYIGEKK